MGCRLTSHFPGQMATSEYGSASRTWFAPLVKVITFILHGDFISRIVFESAFKGVRMGVPFLTNTSLFLYHGTDARCRITSATAQSGHPPHASSLSLVGGPTPPTTRNEPGEKEKVDLLVS